MTPFASSIVPAQPPTLLLSAVRLTQILAFGQQSPIQALNDSLLGDADFHAAFEMVWPQTGEAGARERGRAGE
jgi:hypothetical protein